MSEGFLSKFRGKKKAFQTETLKLHNTPAASEPVVSEQTISPAPEPVKSQQKSEESQTPKGEVMNQRVSSQNQNGAKNQNGAVMNEKFLSQNEKNYTPEEYMEMERRSASKHEFIDGKILSTAGSSRRHNLIGTNTTIAIGSRLRGHKCEVYVNDMRVQLSHNHFSYPDVVVVSGEPKFVDSETDVLLNPTVVVEVFSISTMSYDKTIKLESYLAMESVREILLIKEDDMRVEHYFKQNAKQWIYRLYNAGDDIITLESINCKISLSEIYSQVKFDRNDAVKSHAVN